MATHKILTNLTLQPVQSTVSVCCWKRTSDYTSRYQLIGLWPQQAQSVGLWWLYINRDDWQQNLSNSNPSRIMYKNLVSSSLSMGCSFHLPLLSPLNYISWTSCPRCWKQKITPGILYFQYFSVSMHDLYYHRERGLPSHFASHMVSSFTTFPFPCSVLLYVFKARIISRSPIQEPAPAKLKYWHRKTPKSRCSPNIGAYPPTLHEARMSFIVYH